MWAEAGEQDDDSGEGAIDLWDSVPPVRQVSEWWKRGVKGKRPGSQSQEKGGGRSVAMSLRGRRGNDALRESCGFRISPVLLPTVSMHKVGLKAMGAAEAASQGES